MPGMLLAVCLCQGRELGVDSCRDELEGTTHAAGVSSGGAAGLRVLQQQGLASTKQVNRAFLVLFL